MVSSGSGQSLSAETDSLLTVFYDGSCPLCLREISFYRRAQGAEKLRWIDVSGTEGVVTEGLSCQQAMQRFHVLEADGRLVQGGAAFATLWAALPRWRWLGVLFLRQPFRTLLNGAYLAFLPIRPHLQRLARL